MNDVKCGFQGIDVCSIDSSVLEANKTYYLGVYCMKSCKF